MFNLIAKQYTIYAALLMLVSCLAHYTYIYFVQYHVVIYLLVVASAPLAALSFLPRTSLPAAVSLFWVFIPSILLAGLTTHSLFTETLVSFYSHACFFNYAANFACLVP